MVGDGHDALLGIRGRIVACCRLKVNDLLTLIHFHAQVTSFAFQLRVLTLLVLDLLVELLLLRGVCLETILRVLVKLLELVLEALLILLILLLVLALDDLIRLFCDTVELNI